MKYSVTLKRCFQHDLIVDATDLDDAHGKASEKADTLGIAVHFYDEVVHIEPHIEEN